MSFSLSCKIYILSFVLMAGGFLIYCDRVKCHFYFTFEPFYVSKPFFIVFTYVFSSLYGGLPLTGDAQVDADIEAFAKARQSLLQSEYIESFFSNCHPHLYFKHNTLFSQTTHQHMLSPINFRQFCCCFMSSIFLGDLNSQFCLLYNTTSLSNTILPSPGIELMTLV